MPVKPPCFDSQAEYDRWADAVRISGVKVREHTHCEDCTFDHQSAMIRAGRCTNPGFIFAKHDTQQ